MGNKTKSNCKKMEIQCRMNSKRTSDIYLDNIDTIIWNVQTDKKQSGLFYFYEKLSEKERKPSFIQ